MKSACILSFIAFEHSTGDLKWAWIPEHSVKTDRKRPKSLDNDKLKIILTKNRRFCFLEMHLDSLRMDYGVS